ncbi:MAG: GNAT family N-acetyltransferase [Burkholderiaceae bacterium]
MVRMAKLTVKPTALSDVDAIVKLQSEVYPNIDPWKRDHLLHQLEVFPEGQLVAKLNGRIVGCASSLVILWDEWADEHSWSQITAAGTFDTHNPNGMTLYGAEVFVDPRLRGKRVGHALYEGRRQLCKRLNLRRIVARLASIVLPPKLASHDFGKVEAAFPHWRHKFPPTRSHWRRSLAEFSS